MKRNIIFKLLLPLILFTGLISVNAQVITSRKEFLKYLEAKEKKYEEISVNFGTQTWNLYSMENKADIKSAKELYLNLFNDKALHENIYKWKQNLKNEKDPVLKRRVEIWKKILDASRIEFDPAVVNLSARLLEEVRNRDPKNVEQSARLEKEIIELIKLRNEKARSCGFNNYAEFVYESSGLGYKWFNDFVNLADKKTEPVYKELFEKIKSEKGSVGIMDIARLRKMIQEPRFSNDSLYLLMKETLSDIGVDYSKLPIRFVVKSADFGGNCIGVSIPEDLRVIMVPDMPISVYLHELGHGLQWMKTSINNPILEGYEWCSGSCNPGFYEGMAQMLAGFCKQPEWYKKYAKFSDEKAKNFFTRDKYSEAVNIRLSMVGFLLEAELYKDPAKTPAEIYSGLIKEYLWIDMKMPFSMVNTLFVDYPCYLHNYFIADVIAWQVHDTLKKKFGENYLFNKNVGRYLIDNLYKDGTLKEWRQILKDATGRELDLEGYLKNLGI